MEIVVANLTHLENLTTLFDGYRVFYQQPSGLAGARQFVQARLEKGDSTILVAQAGNELAGFTQLYPSFSSVAMKPLWILNDLFVAEIYRGQGIARGLIEAAETFARDGGAIRVVLETQVTNTSAQALYEGRGYVKDMEFYHYSLSL
ncbi:MAG: GNAT family N-acetyltransferase [Leptolyngbya sp.]|nr:MAG: GNAT family N-acetyltransferase [Leptolyngbya sp.]